MFALRTNVLKPTLIRGNFSSYSTTDLASLVRSHIMLTGG